MPSGIAKTCTDENCSNITVRVFVHIPLHSRAPGAGSRGNMTKQMHMCVPEPLLKNTGSPVTSVFIKHTNQHSKCTF